MFFLRIATLSLLAYTTFNLAEIAHGDRSRVSVVGSMSPPPPAIAVSGTRVVDVRRADLERTVALVASARIVPALRDGAPIGVKFYAIRPDSPLALIGLENGDTLIAVNDVPASSPDVALYVYGPQREPDHLDLDVERRGERVRIVVLLH
jgi:type II secretory pathway component PulC